MRDRKSSHQYLLTDDKNLNECLSDIQVRIVQELMPLLDRIDGPKSLLMAMEMYPLSSPLHPSKAQEALLNIKNYLGIQD